MSDMEVWKPAPGYEGLYSVSDRGRVRSESRMITASNGERRRLPESILKPYKNTTGHLRVDLWENHKRKRRYVHRLVLEAFVGEAPPGTQTCHWNDDPEDNRLENLRWGTPNENMLDRVRNGIHHNDVKTHCKWGHEFTVENTIPLSSDRKGRQCKTCANAWHKAKRRGLTVEEYFMKEKL